MDTTSPKLILSSRDHRNPSSHNINPYSGEKTTHCLSVTKDAHGQHETPEYRLFSTIFGRLIIMCRNSDSSADSCMVAYGITNTPNKDDKTPIEIGTFNNQCQNQDLHYFNKGGNSRYLITR